VKGDAAANTQSANAASSVSSFLTGKVIGFFRFVAIATDPHQHDEVGILASQW
jgi:hypothetical protein